MYNVWFWLKNVSNSSGAFQVWVFMIFNGMQSINRMQNRHIFMKNRKTPHIFKDFRVFSKIQRDATDAWDAPRHASVILLRILLSWVVSVDLRIDANFVQNLHNKIIFILLMHQNDVFKAWCVTGHGFNVILTKSAAIRNSTETTCEGRVLDFLSHGQKASSQVWLVNHYIG